MNNSISVIGGKKLEGKVILSGAKNVALKVLIASLLFDSDVVIDNIPRIKDVEDLIFLIKDIGGEVTYLDKNKILINGLNLKKNIIDLFYGSKIRVSFLFFAPLLLRFKECYIPNPGGCRIGARPIDRIIEGMIKLGVNVKYDSKTGFYHAKLENKINGEYSFPKPTHTGTELLILLSVISDGEVIIKNAALEPEIDDLINFLNQGGALIKRNGPTIYIKGQKKLKQKQEYKIISDRNELVTYASLLLATKGEGEIGPIDGFLVENFNNKIKEIGAEVKLSNKKFYYYKYINQLKSSEIITSPHPGFMTDWQPNWAVLMTQAKGRSVIIERVFENRFSYVNELKKLGAKINFLDFKPEKPKEFYLFNYETNKNYQQAIEINGPINLHNGIVNINDLRAGASLLIATLVSEGRSIINGVHNLERGYEAFREKVKNLGGQIEKN